MKSIDTEMKSTGQVTRHRGLVGLERNKKQRFISVLVFLPSLVTQYKMATSGVHINMIIRYAIYKIGWYISLDPRSM